MVNHQLKHVKDFTLEEKKTFREKYDVFFFDMDGTLEHTNGSPIPGVADAVKVLASLDEKLHVFTDSCLYSKELIETKIHKSFPFIEKENILTTPKLLVNHLKTMGFNKKIYVMGEENGIVKDLRDAGFSVISDHELREYKLGDILGVKFEEGVGAVVLGLDFNFNYLKLFKALNYLTDPDCLFLLSHCSLIAQRNPTLPVAGSLALPISKISQKEFQAFSKGIPYSVEYIHSQGYPMEKCLFVGDLQVNDICCGNKCGMDTLLVLCGATKSDEVSKYIDESDLYAPTYVADSIADLHDIYLLNDT